MMDFSEQEARAAVDAYVRDAGPEDDAPTWPQFRAYLYRARERMKPEVDPSHQLPETVELSEWQKETNRQHFLKLSKELAEKLGWNN